MDEPDIEHLIKELAKTGADPFWVAEAIYFFSEDELLVIGREAWLLGSEEHEDARLGHDLAFEALEAVTDTRQDDKSFLRAMKTTEWGWMVGLRLYSWSTLQCG
jgi:hypothetical protein